MASSSGSRSRFVESEIRPIDLDNTIDQLQRDVATQESGEIGVENSQAQHKFQSDIFQTHFKKQRKSDGSYDVICNYCGKIYKFKAGGGYGTFHRHMQQKHSTQIGIHATQTQIFGYTSNTSSSQLFHYSDDKNKKELAKMICVEHLSFNFGEKVGFVNYCQNALNPSAKRVPRNTLKRTIFSLYKKGKKELHDLFSNLNGRVSICSDIWSDHWQMHSYMGITCHWIDNEWQMQKKVIAYRVFDNSHSAYNIYRMIKNILEEYSLVHKIFSISFDNAAANTASITELQNSCQPNIGGKFFHVRCACHVLNLCVQDGLKSLDIVISPIKKAISFLWSHPQVMKEWAKFCKINNKRPKRFPRDVPTRWNSTYELLNESYEYKELLCTFISNNVPQVTLYPQNWDVCTKFLDILKVFNDATYILSGVYYPTSHLFFIECLNIVGALQEFENDLVLKNSIALMKKKWLDYYKFIPNVNLVAIVFYPRCRLDGLQDYLSFYYSCLNFDFTDPEIVNFIDISSIITNVRKILLELYNEFSTIYRTTVNSPSPSISISSSQSSDSQFKSKISFGDRVLMQRHKRPKGSTGSSPEELDIYLTTAFEFGDSKAGKDFPVLEWWSRHQNTFPILSQIARQILATPISTVAVEQTFSAGGNILDETRSSLAPESLEAQVCVDDWSKAELRQQEIVKLNEGDEDLFDFATDETTTVTSGGGSD